MNARLLSLSLLLQIAFSVAAYVIYKSSGGTLLSEISFLQPSWPSLLGICCVGTVTCFIATEKIRFGGAVLWACAAGSGIAVSKIVTIPALYSTMPIRSIFTDLFQLTVRIIACCIALSLIDRNPGGVTRNES